VIDKLVALLRGVARGEIVDRLVAEAEAAKLAVDEDDRLEALAKFLHVAQESDDFGFDVLGYLPPLEGIDPKALLLEVKSAGTRSFPVSTAEWRRADQQGDNYAFLVYLREPKPSLELVPNPRELLRKREISRDPDSWAVSYEPLAPRGSPAV
jgi:hypothetical protein